MRDYEKLVKGLKYCFEHDDCGSRCPYFSPTTVCADERAKEAASAIEELLAKVPTWISVEERLPEPGKVVLTYNSPLGLQSYGIDLVLDGKWHFDEFTQWWMPLPEPPKEME